ncbi:MAG: periplasmic heavy metal sensor [Candidatus Omnitrophica bacterium]|nr:periplasmic heavy metal sensor [Candidatus Omnitrophota bacterium]
MRRGIGGFMAVVTAAAVIFSAAFVYAGEMRGVPQGAAKRDAHFKKMAEELKLTPEQKDALDKDRAEFMAKSKDLKEKIRAARVALKEELEKPVTDTARVNTLVADLKNLVGQQIQYRVDKVTAMKRVLTPEQFGKMKASMEKKMRRFKDRSGKSKGHWHGHKDDGGKDGPAGV